MERKTRNEKRKDQNRATTSGLARVLRRRLSIRLALVASLVDAVLLLVPSVGCNAWRSIGRVDSSRGEYLIEDADAGEIWRATKPEVASETSSIRGKEVDYYESDAGRYAGEQKQSLSLSERFKYMFRKPKYSTPVPNDYSLPSSENYQTPRQTFKTEPAGVDASKYIKKDASALESRASLSGKPNLPDSSKESFWTKLFKTPRNVPYDYASNASGEGRTGGLAYDDLENEQYRQEQRAIAEQTPQQTQIRRRWSSRDPLNNVGTTAAPRPQNAPGTTVAPRQQNAPEANVALKSQSDARELLIRHYDLRRFLPPFDVVEQYYYPSGVVETSSPDGSELTIRDAGSVSNAADGSYRSSYYAPKNAPARDESVAQTSYSSAPTSRSVYATSNDANVQNNVAEGTNAQDSETMARRRAFAWFDFAPGSLTPSEQANETNANVVSAELQRAILATSAPERYEGKTNGYRSADEILDESARRQRCAEQSSASRSVSYEAPQNEGDSLLNASSIGVDVFGGSTDVSALVDRALETSGVVAAVNSLDERKSDAASAPLTREEIEWVEHVERAIQGLLAERAELKKRGEDTSVCDARLRLLYLVVGEYDRQIQAIDDVDDPLKVFWEKECDGLEKLLQNKLEEIDPAFVAETLMSGLDSFFDVCNVQIRKALLVDSPACFGLFEERVKPYRPGEVVYAYAELDYVVSRETTRGHEIAVECRWRLLDSNGNALTEFKTQRCENVAETRLRDVVLNVAVPLSDEIAPNDYILELEIVDLNARESVATTRRLDVKVVADSQQGARG